MRTRSARPAVGYLALAIADTLLAARRGTAARRARAATKPLLMPTLAVALGSRTAGQATRLTKGVLVAQACSWAGDVALLGKGGRAFLAGLGSFFVGHVGYIAAFGSARDRSAPLRTPGTQAAAALLAVAGPAMVVAAGRKDARMRIPVAAYTCVLATMFAASTRLDPALPAESRRAIVAGTSLFLISDTILGIREFVLDQPSPAVDAAVMATYTAGQGLIAAGAAISG
ncbi:Uncharacterized membrane protein YhhN [Amycolatopsis xylanica]|uniref:Uncharacterized membrane protein YhhN n=1 Tax=Amycolatopsis xylanica TaxID=589385 RepID=A0A1H3S8U8_9PSEU|nr:lysoplasmalogenase [Amycolatopsis xylanica]SDZ33971.1 Uncharacterized membrane protein YhhN [Amycolatopsis xylanica]